MDRLLKFGIQIPIDCIFCGQTLESFDHLFFECAMTRAMWHRLCVCLGFQRPILDWNSEVHWVNALAKKQTGLAEVSTVAFAMIVAMIWREEQLQIST